MFNINYALAKSLQTDHLREANHNRLARQIAAQRKRIRQKLTTKPVK